MSETVGEMKARVLARLQKQKQIAAQELEMWTKIERIAEDFVGYHLIIVRLQIAVLALC